MRRQLSPHLRLGYTCSEKLHGHIKSFHFGYFVGIGHLSRSEARPLALSCSLLSVLPVSGFISSSLELESRSPLEIIVVVILFEEGLIFGQTGRGLEGRCGSVGVALVVAFVVLGGRWIGC